MGVFRNLLGTLLDTFSIGPKGSRATLDVTALTADRVLTLPDRAGTLALEGDPVGALHYRRDDLTAVAGNSRFVLDQAPYESSLTIYQNGVLLAVADYSLSASQATLQAPAAGGEVFSVAYWSGIAAAGTILETIVATDPSWASVSALLHFDGADGSTTFTDEKGVPWTKFSGASISTAQSKFGGSSLHLTGPNQSNLTSLSTAPGFDLIGSDFTIEMWVRVPAYQAGGSRLFSTGGGTLAWNASNGIHVLFQMGATGLLTLQMSKATTAPAVYDGSNPVPTGQFVFVTACWVHSEQKAYLGVNGVVQSSSPLVGVARPSSSPIAAIGKVPRNDGTSESDSSCLSGHVDDFRLTKGFARYTANFTPPSAPFPDSSGDHTVTITSINDPAAANGTVVKSSTATVDGGVGPFTYLWSWQSGGDGMVITGETNATCTVTSTGTNQINSGSLLCQVTDTGNGNVVASDTALVNITHGIPP